MGRGLGKSRSRKRVTFTSIIFLVSFVFGRRARQEEEKRKFVRRWRIFNGQTERENRLNRSFPPFFSSFPCCLLGKRIFSLSRALATQFICFLNRPKCWAESERCVFFFFVFLFPFSIFQQQLIYSQTKNAEMEKLWKRGKLEKKNVFSFLLQLRVQLQIFAMLFCLHWKGISDV